MTSPGLAGVTIADGARAPRSTSTADRAGSRRGGARKDGHESTWTVLGASRGEAGILGEGIRQALLRDPTYAPALEAAGAMLA